jgi:hypothetical protein
MSGVVLRCPSCGTTKASGGECEACHEAQVRYYCTIHTPGRWLDSSVCPECGAQFGVADPASAAPAPPPRPRRPAPPATPRSAGPRPSREATIPARPERPRGYTSWPTRGPWGRRRPSEDEHEPRPRGEAIRDALERRLPELLREAARARRARDIEGPPIGVAAPGCLRAALLLMLFFLFVMFAVSTLLGSLFVSW